MKDITEIRMALLNNLIKNNHPMKDKIDSLLAEIKTMEDEKSSKSTFCRQHNFELQAQIEYDKEQLLRRVQRIIKKHLI